MTINVGIVGYGNLGRGVEAAISKAEDMTLAGIFTRRSSNDINPESGASVYHVSDAVSMKDEVDVMILCGGSATDLVEQTPFFAKHFNVVDSFDTHANIHLHHRSVGLSAREGTTLALISAGWDPGLFSINRLYNEAIDPEAVSYTFWGKGVSQGRSDAIRHIDGVLDAKQYTIPNEEALQTVRNGERPIFDTKDKHKRECFVVAEEGADLERITREIVTMKNYFDEYETIVNFITKEELERDHSQMAHGGVVLTSGEMGVIEYSLTLPSNPKFTASVLVAYARAVHRMREEGIVGCITPLEVAPAYLSPKSSVQLWKELL